MSLIAGGNTVKGDINGSLDVNFALNLGKIIGKKYAPTIALAVDDRTSNTMLKTAFTAGVMSVGCDIVDLGMVPTPVLQFYMLQNRDIPGGVVITASFAGPEFNGFRVFGRDGMEDPIFDSITLDDIINDDTPCVEARSVGRMIFTDDVIDEYVESIVQHVDVKAIENAHLCIGLDCRNTAVAKIASVLLMRLSVTCITLGGDRSAMGIDRMNKLGKIVAGPEVDIGVALEMDADNCMFTTSEGYPVSGDKSFAVIAEFIISRRKGTVVMPVNSSTLMEDIVKKHGCILKHTTVGEQMAARKVKEYNAILGGDIFGCMVIPDHLYSCDGLMVMALMLECVAKSGPLADLIADYPTYHLKRASVECPEEKRAFVLEKIKAKYINSKVDLIDGIKIWVDGGWILIRLSSIRNFIKVYVESKDETMAKALVDETVKQVIDAIESA